MKTVRADLFAVPVNVQVNTMNKNRDQWARVIDARNGKILHTGQLPYIKKIVRKKYNVIIED
jgi:hypothetical protein